jgi:carbon monoxide dehydrogenase subunit G
LSRVTASIDIDAPPEKVWDVVMDPQRLGEWVTIHRDLEEVSDNPLKDGSTLKQKLCLRGVNFHVKWTVAESREAELAVWDGRGPARSKAHTSYRLAPNGNGGTRFDYENEFALPGGALGKVAGGLLSAAPGKREARRSLDRLRALLEGNGGEG